MPFLSEIKDRLFPLKTKADDVAENFFVEDLYSGGGADELHSKRIKVVIDKLESFCPELIFERTGAAPDHESIGGNIKVRHIQPMGSGARFCQRPFSSSEPDPQSRKSLNMLRKAFFEQTSKIFHVYKGTLIYDVMNSSIEKKFQSVDG